MKMKINNNVKIIEIEYNQVMQFCGFNVNEKNKVIEAIKKYFNGSKYMEYE